MHFDNKSPVDLHLEMFILHQKSSRHTKNTIEFYQTLLTIFVDHIKELDVKSAGDLTAHQIREFIISLEDQDYADSYVHGYARAIKTWLNFLVREEVLDRNPMRKVKMPKVETKILPPYTEDDIRKLVDACYGEYKIRDRAIVLGLLDTGLRASEFIGMNVGDIEDDGVVTVKGKGRKERHVRLSARTRMATFKWLSTRTINSEKEPLWNGRHGRLSRKGLYQVIRRLGKRVDVEPATVHRFRRTFAIASLRNGIDVHRLKEILGHSDLATAQQYLSFVREDIVDAHRKTSPVENWGL